MSKPFPFFDARLEGVLPTLWPLGWKYGKGSWTGQDEYGGLWGQNWVRKKISVVTSVRIIGADLVYTVTARKRRGNVPVSQVAWRMHVRPAFFATDLDDAEIVDSPEGDHPLASLAHNGYRFVAVRC